MNLHTSETCPVNPADIVVYRTVNAITGTISHIHAPMIAQEINWKKSAKTHSHIYDYAKAKKMPAVSRVPLFTPNELAKKDRMFPPK